MRAASKSARFTAYDANAFDCSMASATASRVADASADASGPFDAVDGVSALPRACGAPPRMSVFSARSNFYSTSVIQLSKSFSFVDHGDESSMFTQYRAETSSSVRASSELLKKLTSSE